MQPARIDAIVSDWQARDHARAPLPADRAAVVDSEAARALVVRLVSEEAAPAELLGAWLRLGRLLAERGASPTLLAGTVDGLAEALLVGVPRAIDDWAAARAAVLEGALAVAGERLRRAGRTAWDYPGCVAVVREGSAAVCGPPDRIWDEDDAAAAWAARVASGLARRGVKEVVVTAGPVARAELEAALASVGAAVVPALAPAKKSLFGF